ncbi:MAG: class I SAM-dependent methyltransferase [Alphaproteobacteria bacterium]
MPAGTKNKPVLANRPDLEAEWQSLAPAWIRESREGKNANRTGLLDGPMLEACGDVTGLSVLDSGCGEGRFCRMMAERGASHVLGIDLCASMIEAAKSLATGKDEYRVADAQDLGFLQDASFNLAISYLNQCDLPDFAANTREVFRVLKKGGRFVIANLHPMRSAVGTWQKTPEGVKQHVVLDRYFDEGERRWKMMGVEFTNFHRSLQTSIRAFRKAGFLVDDIIEPTATPENLKRYPEIADELRVPNFIVFVLEKH